MSKDKSNLTEEDETSEEEELNPAEEDESEDSSEIDELFDEDEEDTLSQINEGAKKSFKDVGQVVKALKQQDKEFIKKGASHQQETKKEPKSSPKMPEAQNRDERLLKLESPESEFVLDEMKDIARDTRKSILDIWDESAYLKNEAKARAEAHKQKATDKTKVGAPSGSPTGTGEISIKGVQLSASDKEFMAKHKLSAKDIAEAKKSNMV